MTLDEVLSYDVYHYERIHKFVAQTGIQNVTVADLDKIIARYGHEILGIVDFFQLYNIVSSNESNRVMKRWTQLSGVCTVVVTVATIVNLIVFILSLQ
jgi:hypothetical protein